MALAFDSPADDAYVNFHAGLGRVAKALEAGDRVCARIAAVQLRIPEFATEKLAKLAVLADLGKYNFDEHEDRDPHGRWEDGGGSSRVADSAETRVADASADDLKIQHELARSSLAAVWRQSQIEQREYFGLIYRTEDGSYHATRAVPAYSMVSDALIDQTTKEVPDGAAITASFHTHFNNSIASVEEKEQFSTQDRIASRDRGWDAYMGTAISGHLKYYNIKRNSISDLGRLNP